MSALPTKAATPDVDVPFLDAHVHFWDHAESGLEWSWVKPGFVVGGVDRGGVDIDRPRFGPSELLAEAGGTGLAGVVHVQSADRMPDPVVETAWLQQMADREGLPTAIVAACAVRGADAPDILRRHAAHDRYRGVRDLWFPHRPDPEELAPAMAVLAETGASLEAKPPVASWPAVRQLADRWPEVTLVLGHAGLGDDRSPAAFDDWRAGLDVLAGAPNFRCKISAVITRRAPHWTIDDIRPWITACVEAFGPDRCLLASDYPYDQPAATYRRIVDAYREILAPRPLDEQHALFHGTAEAVYRVDVT